MEPPDPIGAFRLFRVIGRHHRKKPERPGIGSTTFPTNVYIGATHRTRTTAERRRALGEGTGQCLGSRGGLTGAGSVVVLRGRGPLAAALSLLEDVQALAQAAERGG